jgi:hypothetical protein
LFKKWVQAFNASANFKTSNNPDFLLFREFAELDSLASDGGVIEAQSSSSTEAADNIV